MCVFHPCVIPHRFRGEESAFAFLVARAFALALDFFGDPTQGLRPFDCAQGKLWANYVSSLRDLYTRTILANLKLILQGPRFVCAHFVETLLATS